MEIEEVKKYKKELEDEITKIVSEFSSNTDTIVSNISLEVNPIWEQNRKRPTAVFYTVSVEVKI